MAEQQWTQQQQAFWAAWQQLRQQLPVGTDKVERGSWPEDNSEILADVTVLRQAHYRHLNELYFAAGDIVLELGAESRTSWSDSIDTDEVVVVRTSWSQKPAHPAIWQVPVQQLLRLLDSPAHAWMAQCIDMIVMENTLGCLPLPLPQELFAFGQKYSITIVDLSYRPLSAPQVADMQATSRRKVNPYRDCPAFVVAAQELLYLISANKVADHEQKFFYAYRPPTGSPIVQLRHLSLSTTKGQQERQKLQQLVQQSGEAVQILSIPQTVAPSEQSKVSFQLFASLLRILLQLHERPKAKYRVHMQRQPPTSELSVVQAWFLGLLRLAKRHDVAAQLHFDVIGGYGKEERLHTACGESINPMALISMWTQAGFPEQQVRNYAYGLAGMAPERLGVALRQHRIAEHVDGVLQVRRLQFTPQE